MSTLENLAATQLTIGRTLDLARYLALQYQTDGPAGAADAFAARYPRSPNLELVRKAAVGFGTSRDPTWAGPLATSANLESAFVDYLRPLTIVGRLPTRSVPFKTQVSIATGAGTYLWVGEGVPKPVTKTAYGSTLLEVCKVAGIIAVTKELLRLSVPNAEVLLRDELAAGLAQMIDLTFVDQSLAPSASSPGGITNGVTPIAPSGTTPAALAKDVSTLLAQFWTNNPGATRARLVMGPNHVNFLVDATNSQTLTVDGGTYAGVPVVVSGNTGARILALDAAQVLVADGGLELDMSKTASIQMDSAPDNPATASTVLTSLWQANLVGLRGERTTNWQKARATAVSLIAPTAYVP